MACTNGAKASSFPDSHTVQMNVSASIRAELSRDLSSMHLSTAAMRVFRTLSSVTSLMTLGNTDAIELRSVNAATCVFGHFELDSRTTTRTISVAVARNFEHNAECGSCARDFDATCMTSPITEKMSNCTVCSRSFVRDKSLAMTSSKLLVTVASGTECNIAPSIFAAARRTFQLSSSSSSSYMSSSSSLYPSLSSSYASMSSVSSSSKFGSYERYLSASATMAELLSSPWTHIGHAVIKYSMACSALSMFTIASSS